MHNHIASYQAVSGAGRVATEALSLESADVLNGIAVEPSVFPKRIAFNVIPQAGDINDDGHSEEEMKLMRETRKIMEADDIDIVATCVRVPVFNGHSEAVHINTSKDISATDARNILNDAEGITVSDNEDEGAYQTASQLGADSSHVYVSRIRKTGDSLCMWVVADNLRKGAALNSVQIAEHWLRMTQ